jgi:hypothetical protein
MALACRICIAERGLRGSEISSLHKTEDELVEHLEQVHHYVVTRDGETDEQALARCNAAYPERATCQECAFRCMIGSEVNCK